MKEPTTTSRAARLEAAQTNRPFWREARKLGMGMLQAVEMASHYAKTWYIERHPLARNNFQEVLSFAGLLRGGSRPRRRGNELALRWSSGCWLLAAG